jgi:hypothetical protein
MSEELLRVAARCDGVRCDMAMLLLPDAFERTWGRPAQPFWAEAIARVRRDQPGFEFLAEVYWDLEWTMQQLGFDHAYDKRLYDRLVAGQPGPVRDHLGAGLDYQSRLARFLENHDEPRAAATFPTDRHKPATLLTYLTPGLRFIQLGQLEGHRVHVAPQLIRAPDEPLDPERHAWYAWLLTVLREPLVRDGDWQLLERAPAWDGNGSLDSLIAFAWSLGAARWVVVVNFSASPAQAYIRPTFDDLRGRMWHLIDRVDGVRYERSGDDLAQRGLYVDLGPWRSHVFDLAPGPTDT